LKVTMMNDLLDNWSMGRGSVFFAASFASRITALNSNFIKNYSTKGGIIYAHISSSVTLSNCTLTGNRAIEGGVAYVNDEGAVTIFNSTLRENYAIQGNVLFLMNSMEYSSNLRNATLIDNVFPEI